MARKPQRPSQEPPSTYEQFLLEVVEIERAAGVKFTGNDSPTPSVNPSETGALTDAITDVLNRLERREKRNQDIALLKGGIAAVTIVTLIVTILLLTKQDQRRDALHEILAFLGGVGGGGFGGYIFGSGELRKRA